MIAIEFSDYLVWTLYALIAFLVVLGVAGEIASWGMKQP